MIFTGVGGREVVLHFSQEVLSSAEQQRAKLEVFRAKILQNNSCSIIFYDERGSIFRVEHFERGTFRPRECVFYELAICE